MNPRKKIKSNEYRLRPNRVRSLMSNDLTRLPAEILSKIFRSDPEVFYLSRCVSKEIRKHSYLSIAHNEYLKPLTQNEKKKFPPKILFSNDYSTVYENKLHHGTKYDYSYFITLNYHNDIFFINIDRLFTTNRMKIPENANKFDLLSTYRILQHRGLCLEINPNYAKNKLVGDLDALSDPNVHTNILVVEVMVHGFPDKNVKYSRIQMLERHNSSFLILSRKIEELIK